jgi:hypothetical protein
LYNEWINPIQPLLRDAEMGIKKFVICIFVMMYSLAAHCDELTKEKKQNIEKLLMFSYMVGPAAPFIDQTSKDMFAIYQKEYPNIYATPTMDIIKQELAKSLTEAFTPTYHKYLTNKEIKEVLAFYTSEAGVKFFAVYPAILNETSRIDDATIKNINVRIRTALENVGVIPKAVVAADPFGAAPKGMSMNCGPEQRFKFDDKIKSTQDFSDFLKKHLTQLKDKQGNDWTQLDNFLDIKSGANAQPSIDWKKVTKAVGIEKIEKRTIYKLDYMPNMCGGQRFTIKATEDGHVSIYGCCGK